MPERRGALQVGQINCTFEMLIGASFSAMPPLICFCGLGRVCRLIMCTCSTSTRFFLGNTSRTRPDFPASAPLITCTRSFFLTVNIAFLRLACWLENRLQNFRGQRYDF